MMVSNASHSVKKRMKKPAMATKIFIHTPVAYDTISGVGREEKFLQLCKTVRKGNGFLGPVQKGCQAIRHIRACAEGPFDDFGELGWMRGGEHDSPRRGLVLFGETLPAQHSDGGVRIEDIAV